MVDDTRQQNQRQQVSSNRTWEQIGAENRQRDQPQLNQTTPVQQNKLADVLTPPTTALTKYFPQPSYSTPSSSSTGTYNTSTGVYTNTQGQGFSYGSAPQGSTIVSNETNKLTQVLTPYINKSNTISSQLNQPKQNEIRALSTTDTGYLKPYTLNKLEPFFSPSLYKKGAVGFLGDVYTSFSDAGEFTFKGSKTKQFNKRQSIIENIANAPKNKNVSPYLKMTQGLGYEEFYKDKVNPIFKQREKEYSSLYSKKQKQAEEEYTLAKSKISSGSDYETTVKTYQTNISKINKELSSFEFPNTATDILGQPVSKRPEFLNTNLPSQFQVTPNITPYSKTQSIVDKSLSNDFKLLQEGYREIGKTLKIQETGENIGENILTLAPFTVIPAGRVSSVGKLSFGDDMRIRENVNQLGDKGFVFNEVRFGAETQTSTIKGYRSSGGLKQDVELVVPKIINQEGSFYAPYGKYNLKTTGVISPDLVGSQKPIILNSYQSGSLGSKGFSLQTGEEGLYATIGKGTLMPELETSGFVYAEKNFMKQFDVVKSYHGTTNLYESKILSEGLKSGKATGVSQRFNDLKLNEVYTTPSKEWANSWANMASYGKGKEVGKPLVLEINMPRETFQKSLIKRGIEKGGAEEFTFKSIDSKYVNKLGEYNFKPDMPKNFRQDMFNQFERNLKFKQGEYTTNAFMGVTKSLGKGFDTKLGDFEGYVTRSGKISKIEVNPTKDFDIIKNTYKRTAGISNANDIEIIKAIESGEKPLGELQVFNLKEIKSLAKQEGFKISGKGEYFTQQGSPIRTDLKFIETGSTGFVGKNAKGETIEIQSLFGKRRIYFKEGNENLAKELIKSEKEYFDKRVTGKLTKHYMITEQIKTGKMYGYKNWEINEYILKSHGSEAEKYLLPEKIDISNLGNLKVSGFGTDKNKFGGISNDWIKIDTNLKDVTFTKVAGRPNIERDFYIKSGRNELGLKSFQESKTPTEFLYKETVQQFKQELKPNIKLDTGFKVQGQSLVSGSSLMTKSKSLSGFGMSSLEVNQNKINPRFFSRLSTRDLSSFSQSSGLITKQATKQSQVQAQAFNLDLGLKQTQQNGFNTGSFNFNPNMNMDFGYGGGGFAIPQFSLGANYLISKPKKRNKRKKQKIRPSFTAEVFNIRGSLPKQGSLGVSPFNLRAIPKSFKNPLNINF